MAIFSGTTEKRLPINRQNGLRTSIESVRDLSEAPVGVDEFQWSSNPYANYDYKHTWWQKLWESMGFRSKWDEFRESMAVNSAEYRSQLADKAHNEQYDSALSQAMREREAGINPDLAGNVDAGSSSPMEPDPNAPIAPTSDDPIQVIQGFGNTVMSIFTSAMGFAQSGLGLMQMKQALEAGNIQNAEALFNLGKDVAVSYIPAKYPGEDTDWINQSSELAIQHLSPFLNSKQRKAFANQLRNLYTTAPVQAEQWDAFLNNAKGKINTLTQYQSSLWGDGSDEVIASAAQIIAKYSDKFIRQSARARAEGAENQAEYESQFDASLQAGVENMTNQRNIEGASIDAILNEALNEIMVDLRDRSESGKRGHQFASAALLLFSLFRMINFSKTSGQVGSKSFESSTIGF